MRQPERVKSGGRIQKSDTYTYFMRDRGIDGNSGSSCPVFQVNVNVKVNTGMEML